MHFKKRNKFGTIVLGDMMNRKGFTLVELLATIVILAIVVGLGSYAIVGIINTAKEKNYSLLVTNIKDASEQYYQECRYSNAAISNDMCTLNESGYVISLGQLVEYGFLKGNGTKEDDTYTIVNPKNDNNISDCMITVTFNNGKVVITNDLGNTNSDCPSNSDYSG